MESSLSLSLSSLTLSPSHRKQPAIYQCISSITRDSNDENVSHHSPCFISFRPNKDLQMNLDVSICHACKINHPNCVKMLIEAGANPLGGDNDRMTPLHVAAYHGNVECARVLIDIGVDINHENKYLKSRAGALHHAADRLRFEMIEFLLDNGAEINKRNAWGNTPLHNFFYSIELEYCLRGPKDSFQNISKIFELFVARGADLNTRDNSGKTLMHEAILSKNAKECIQILLEKGVDPNAKDNKGNTALHYIGDVNPENIDKYKFLLEYAEILISFGAIHDAKNNDGKTPLDLALARNINEDLLYFLSGYQNLPS